MLKLVSVVEVLEADPRVAATRGVKPSRAVLLALVEVEAELQGGGDKRDEAHVAEEEEEDDGEEEDVEEEEHEDVSKNIIFMMSKIGLSTHGSMEAI